MEAFRSLTLGDLPPVGNSISLSTTKIPPPSIPNYDAYWLDTGTSALALALLDAKKHRPDIDKPEVILPAYCCPDLVAAAEHAGVSPVVIDISPSDVAYSPEALTQCIGPNTIAIIAMTFLGIRENWPSLLPFLRSHYPLIKIIEDNAQWFPDLAGDDKFDADYLVFSFGRGKPLSLLGGGALFSKLPLKITPQTKPSAVIPAARKLQYLAYNHLLNPRAYWFLNHNPIFTLGQTIYHPLAEIRPLDNFSLQLLGNNFTVYQQRSRSLEKSYALALEAAGIKSEYLQIGTARQQRLLRFPLLCSNLQQRDTLLRQLNLLGLGASPMYKLPLEKIPQVWNKIQRSSAIPNATNFADRLLTLPIHEGVKEQHVQRIIETLARYWSQT